MSDSLLKYHPDVKKWEGKTNAFCLAVAKGFLFFNQSAAALNNVELIDIDITQ